MTFDEIRGYEPINNTNDNKPKNPTYEVKE